MVMARRFTTVVLVASLVAGGAWASVGAQAAPEPEPYAGLASNANGEFHSLAPARVFDSRSSVGARTISTSGASFDVTLLGRGGVPASAAEVFAVVANITVVRPSVQGYLLAYPKGEPRPLASNLSFLPGQTVPNAAVLRPGADGQVRVVLQGLAPGEAHVVIDVFGWISTSSVTTRGARLRTVNPGRLYDSRSVAPFGPGESRAIQITGRSTPNFTIPSTNVVGVVLNVAGINNRPASQGTFLSILPTAPTGVPGTANLNLAPGMTRSNLVIVPVGPDGRIHVYNDRGQINVTLDVMGFLEANVTAPRAGRIIPMRTPFRAIDTRLPPGPLKLSAGQAEPWDFTGTINTTTVGGAPIGPVGSMIGNFTGTGFERQYYNSPLSTFLSITPSAGPPSVSNLNFGINEVVANLAVARLDSRRQVFVYNAEGLVHYLFDIAAMVLAD